MRNHTNTTRFFLIAFICLALLNLLLVWSFRFPPMQDYPTHLMIAKVLATSGLDSYNWEQHFLIDHDLGPYRLSYFLIAFLHQFLNIETSGKILLSIYFLLIAQFTYSQSRARMKEGYLPWVLLLLFPLAFHQAYYFGFINYLLSLPVLLWALSDFIVLIEGKRGWRRLEPQLYAPVLLFLLHPYSLLIYIVLTATSTVLVRIHSKTIPKSVILPIAWLLAFATWFLLTGFGDSKELTLSSGYSYSGALANAYYFLLPFSGYQETLIDGWVSYLAWVIIITTLILNRGESGHRHVKHYLVLLALGYLLLPFHILGYAYFNLRLAAPLYLFLVLFLAQKELQKHHIAPFLLAVIALYVDIYHTHQKVSSEIEEATTVLSHIPKNSNIVPVYYKTASSGLNKNIFYQFHAHTHDYYHTLVGGGISPGMFYNEMLPVKYRSDITIAEIRKPVTPNSDLEALSPYYDYAFVRMPAQEDIAPSWRLVLKKEQWLLYNIKAEHRIDNGR